MANNRLYLVNRRLGVKVYLARFGSGADFWEPIAGLERKLRVAFAEDDASNWDDHGWELVDEGNVPDGLQEVSV
ncbi:hypothetical protein [Methylobacterium sp. WL7]|uniref:hypothetical protein n=1 Tax=Methylobacterium sp. WL7 TaxID=2603900 RepID=UPI0011C7B729|nr:hypothetical protein [Methylobacterium sp. WL7]TXN34645.1 hypothetical protein FV233_29610 [Methylobacterium sp. WL7]